MRIRLICDNVDTQTGLRLAGVDGAVAHTRDEFESEFCNALSDGEIGVVAITERLAGSNRDLIQKFQDSRRLPLIVEIPDRHGTIRTEDFLMKYMREAVGLTQGGE